MARLGRSQPFKPLIRKFRIPDAAVSAAVWASTGTGAAAWVGRSTAARVLGAAGVGAAAWVGRSTAASVWTSAGVGTFTGVARATSSSVWTAAGIGTASWTNGTAGAVTASRLPLLGAG